jgi:acetyltransferase-like isoleucine patch superfamily enzyme
MLRVNLRKQKSTDNRVKSVNDSVKNYLFNLLMFTHNHIVTNIPSHSIRKMFLRRIMQVNLHQSSATLLGLRLYTRGNLTIGAHSVIDRDCILDTRGGITIGKNVNLAPEVTVLTAYHDPDDEDFCGMEKQVVIEDYVWIATQALILPGVKIGRGAVVGAGSVVTKDVASETIVAGNPAKPIRRRNSSLTYQVVDYRRKFH